MKLIKTVTLAIALFAGAKGSAFSGQAALAPSGPPGGHRDNRATLSVRRKSILADSLHYLLHTTSAQLPVITFIGERGHGLGRGWWQAVADAMFVSETSGLLKPNEDGLYMELDLSKPFTPETRDLYVAAGRLLAMSILENLPTGVKLPQFFWGALLRGDTIDPADFYEEATGQAEAMRDAIAGGDDVVRK